MINMVIILIMSAKMATLGLLKTTVFLSMTSPTKFYHMIIL